MLTAYSTLEKLQHIFASVTSIIGFEKKKKRLFHIVFANTHKTERNSWHSCANVFLKNILQLRRSLQEESFVI